MTTTDETIINFDAIIYPEAPDSFEETESGILILDSAQLKLPGDISFSLGKLKSAKYEKIDGKHVIKLTTASENEIYFTISGVTRLKSIAYAENISKAIRNFAPAAPQKNSEKPITLQNPAKTQEQLPLTASPKTRPQKQTPSNVPNKEAETTTTDSISQDKATEATTKHDVSNAAGTTTTDSKSQENGAKPNASEAPIIATETTTTDSISPQNGEETNIGNAPSKDAETTTTDSKYQENDTAANASDATIIDAGNSTTDSKTQDNDAKANADHDAKANADNDAKDNNEPHPNDALEVFIPKVKETPDPPIYMKIDWGYYKTYYYFEEFIKGYYCGDTYIKPHYNDACYDDYEILDHLGEHNYKKKITDDFVKEKIRPGEYPEVDIKSNYIHLGKNNKIIKYINTTIEAYNRVDDPIGNETLNYTGPLAPQKSHCGSCESFFRGNYCRYISKIKVIKVVITYMDDTSIEITDKKLIDAMMSESSKNLKVDPSPRDAVIMLIRWGHLVEVYNRWGNRKKILKNGIIDDKVDIKIHFSFKLLQDIAGLTLKATLQAYDSSGNSIGKPETTNLKQTEQTITTSGTAMIEWAIPSFFCGKIYSSIDHIKLVNLFVSYNIGEIINYFEITDTEVFNDNISTTNIATNSAYATRHTISTKQEVIKNIDRFEEQEWQEGQEEAKRDQEEAELNKKMARIGVIVKVFVVILLLMGFFRFCTPNLYKKMKVQMAVNEINGLKYNKEKLTLEQCMIYLNSDMYCKIDSHYYKDDYHGVDHYPCSESFKNSLDTTILHYCFKLLDEKCCFNQSVQSEHACHNECWEPIPHDDEPHKFPQNLRWYDARIRYESSANNTSPGL